MYSFVNYLVVVLYGGMHYTCYSTVHKTWLLKTEMVKLVACDVQGCIWNECHSFIAFSVVSLTGRVEAQLLVKRQTGAVVTIFSGRSTHWSQVEEPLALFVVWSGGRGDWVSPVGKYNHRCTSQ